MLIGKLVRVPPEQLWANSFSKKPQTDVVCKAYKAQEETELQHREDMQREDFSKSLNPSF